MRYLQLVIGVLPFCVATTALAQQTTRPSQTDKPLTTLENLRDHQAFTQDGQGDQWLRQKSELSLIGAISLPKARARLADEWKRLGIPPKKAQEIAAAFRSDVPEFAHKSLAGKSDGEVAAMIQAALTTGDYRSANQLLIDFERAKLGLGPMQAEAPES